MLESNYTEILEICEEIEKEEQIKVFGPQIELNLVNPTNVDEPPVEVVKVAPTVVVEVEEESSVEVLEARACKEKEMENQVEGTGNETVLTSVEKKLGDQAVGTGDEPVLKSGKKEMGDEVVQTGDEPVHEAVAERTGAEPVLEDVEMGTGDEPVHDMGVGDFHFEDYPGDDFEKVGEFTPEDTHNHPLPYS